jgi:hypothetical protein
MSDVTESGTSAELARKCRENTEVENTEVVGYGRWLPV